MNDKEWKEYIEKELGKPIEEIEEDAKKRWSYHASKNLERLFYSNDESEPTEGSDSSSR